MTLKSSEIPNFTINYICSCLLLAKIRTTNDLNEKFYPLIAQIKQNPEIFKEHYSVDDCYLILAKAIKAYNNVNDYAIRISNVHRYAFSDAEEQAHLFPVIPIETDDDLSRVTQNYDRFIASHKQKKKVHQLALNLLEGVSYIETSTSFLGLEILEPLFGLKNIKHITIVHWKS